jgi:DNA-binding response OmpR family regulator
MLDAGRHLISKPFNIEDLAAKVRGLLDAEQRLWKLCETDGPRLELVRLNRKKRGRLRQVPIAPEISFRRLHWLPLHFLIA